MIGPLPALAVVVTLAEAMVDCLLDGEKEALDNLVLDAA